MFRTHTSDLMQWDRKDGNGSSPKKITRTLDENSVDTRAEFEIKDAMSSIRKDDG